MIRVRLVRVASIALVFSFACAISRAEWVAYRLEGKLAIPSVHDDFIFGVQVPRTSDVTGTFWYETTTEGTNAGTGARDFRQYIPGGYSLDINHGAVRIAASDYIIDVANDYGSPASDFFTVNYTYDSAKGVTPDQLLVNGMVWPGSRTSLLVSLYWDYTTFEDPDEPKLTSDRPGTPNFFVQAAVADGDIPELFSVTSIQPIAALRADYNRDGLVTANDYVEWRRVYGKTEPQYLYADGNNNGIVDPGDYVFWRKASAFGIGATIVPEPGGLLVAVSGFAALYMGMRPW